ncbi:MAG TPA: hypothetical protein VFZ66_12320 [Herpetosiphonaceae bacterium]
MKHHRSTPVDNAFWDPLEELSKVQLHALADWLLLQDPAAIERCVAFLEAETYGCWHGRARALIARRLKHCALSQEQQARAIDAILKRLVSGRFSEQFKDQLRLVLHLDAERAFAVARGCEQDSREYVRRYAAWILAHRA